MSNVAELEHTANVQNGDVKNIEHTKNVSNDRNATNMENNKNITVTITTFEERAPMSY